MSLWCPKCHYKTAMKKFFNDRCPQCGTAIGDDDVLTKDPFLHVKAKRTLKDVTSKKFQFDQKAGSDTDATPGNIPSVPTETLNLYKQDK